MRFAAVADDLTSAVESAGQLAAAGYDAHVLLAHNPIWRDARSLESLPEPAVVVDTGSRTRAPAEAGQLTEAAFAALRARDLLYKTIDSTVRGHVGVEIAAALRGSRRRRAVVAPAFPVYGRTTVGGVQLLDGEPVGDVAQLLRDAGIDEDLAVVGDATTDADLDTLVQSVPDPASVLWCGSPGLSEALLRTYAGSPRLPAVPAAKRILFLVGSVQEVSRNQLAHLTSAGVPTHTTDQAVADLMTGGVAALTTPSADGRPQEGTGTYAQLLGRTAASILGRVDDVAVVVTGGETAAALAEALGAGGLVVEGELAPAIPWGRLDTSPAVVIVTKAGGFGAPDELLRLAERLGWQR